MRKDLLSSCCNAAILEFKESNETVCLDCYHTTDLQEDLEFDVVRNRIRLHKVVGQAIFLIVLLKVISFALSLFK